MITWMQKHKKYLVVTIWVSTIAFVGAGFVGWGAYDLNKNRATSVAKVGHRNISVQELNEKYSQLYGYYNSIFNGQLTEEKANEIGLSKIALDAAIRENLLLNYADDLGLLASKEDVVRYIIADENFHKDGVFDENLYKDILRRAKINQRDYEKGLERVVLLDKLNYLINTKPTQQDIELMMSAFYMQDKVAIKIITAQNSNINVSDDELKKLWESSKNSYMTKTSYTFDTIFIPTTDKNADEATLNAYYQENKERYKDSDDKILAFENVKEQVKNDYNLEQSKTEALQKYVSFKKGEIVANQTINFTDDNATFEVENLKDIKIGDILKPIVYNGGYVISKVVKIDTPKPMSFEAAKEQVKEKLLEIKERENLENLVKAELKNFDTNGLKQVEISRAKADDIDGLDMFESRNFIDQVFASTNKKGYVVLGKKAVIYEILEQKLLTNTDNENLNLVSENIANLKNGEIMQDLVMQLQKRYKVEEYIKR
ncbi:peptidylprolyl isomerase [Campylobacter gastrosuis]|uniref:Peptidylprolyl isomerase n=1 Tax=Campylobacter gastrosuis TaxID=2974576 RepID=A0ABT7HQK7_9BACT|nr:peptidylprolyl isomerase [Campylobacter gastrosuis]MDL0089124.1 peptidylprolyl isomerase [Campylobacter gastrosuis]